MLPRSLLGGAERTINCARMTTLVTRLLSSVVDALLPISCFGCGAENTYLCSECIEAVEVKPHLKQISVVNYSMPILSMTTLVDGMIHNLLQFYKYQCVPQAGPSIQLLVQKMYSQLPWDLRAFIMYKAVFVPIPLHTSRYKWRGFNQTETIARALANSTGGTVVPLLVRTKNTETQVGKEKSQRMLNIQKAFAINKKSLFPLSLEHTLILVDDVVTTGSTLKEAYKVLARRFPYSKILALTLAHKPLTASMPRPTVDIEAKK